MRFSSRSRLARSLARRAPVLERLLDKLMFDAPDMRGQSVSISGEHVRAELEPILASEDLARFIL